MAANAQLSSLWLPVEGVLLQSSYSSGIRTTSNLYAQEVVEKIVAQIQAPFHMCTKLYSFYLGEANVIEDVDEWFDCKLLILTPSLANASHSLHCPLPLQASTQIIIFSATIIWFAN